jgi:uncharacterized protein (TIGR03067 family)
MSPALLGCLLALSAGADPLDKAAMKELKALEGDWVVVRFEAGGKKHMAGPDEQVILTFRGAKWTFSAAAEQGEVLALDAASSPKLIDLKKTRRGGGGLVREGIYKLDGDTLTLALYQGTEKKRPTSFDTPTEAGMVVFVLRRAKR